VLFIVFVPVCELSAQNGCDSMDEGSRDVEILHRQWAEALGAGDLDRVLSLLDEEYELWAAGLPPVKGREALRPALQAAFGRFRVEARFECEARIVDGALAVERGWDVQVLHPRDGGEPTTQRQRVTLVSGRGPEGKWRFLWGMSQPEG
jgi:ketosteroid isomerase-like protein